MICATEGCENKARWGRKICHTCKNKIHRERNPIMYAFHIVKGNAKRRGKIFKLSYTYFEQWCIDNKYLELKGRGVDDMTIDCIIAPLGYIEGNIQIMSKSENCAKGAVEKKEFWDTYYSVRGIKMDPPVVEIIDLDKVPF